MQDGRHATFICILLAIAATAIAWGAVPWGTFQFDDFRNVVRDPATTDAAVLLERLPHGLRPLTRISYFLDAQLHGLKAGGFLATNLLLHAITVVLVFALARRRLDHAGALIAALAFAVQPANAEVVAYVSGRSTGLMTLLLLGGLLLHDSGERLGACLWRASLWRDPVALWTAAVAKAPYKSRCWNNLGMANLVAQRGADAVVAFERAVFLDPANEYASMNLFTARVLCGRECSGP
jgi:hypothetical protein